MKCRRRSTCFFDSIQPIMTLADLPDNEILRRLLQLNRARAGLA